LTFQPHYTGHREIGYTTQEIIDAFDKSSSTTEKKKLSSMKNLTLRANFEGPMKMQF